MKPMQERGSREELATQLEDLSVGWWRLAKDANAEASAQGAAQLRQGAASVTVGHTVYEVDETGDGSDT